MIKTFTHNDLILYVYNELPDEVKNKLETALQLDHLLAEQCAELLADKRDLDTLKPKPSAGCINNILRYSQSFGLRS
jgi:hypothetical protein